MQITLCGGRGVGKQSALAEAVRKHNEREDAPAKANNAAAAGSIASLLYGMPHPVPRWLMNAPTAKAYRRAMKRANKNKAQRWAVVEWATGRLRFVANTRADARFWRRADPLHRVVRCTVTW